MHRVAKTGEVKQQQYHENHANDDGFVRDEEVDNGLLNGVDATGAAAEVAVVFRVVGPGAVCRGGGEVLGGGAVG